MSNNNGMNSNQSIPENKFQTGELDRLEEEINSVFESVIKTQSLISSILENGKLSLSYPALGVYYGFLVAMGSGKLCMNPFNIELLSSGLDSKKREDLIKKLEKISSGLTEELLSECKEGVYVHTDLLTFIKYMFTIPNNELIAFSMNEEVNKQFGFYNHVGYSDRQKFLLISELMIIKNPDHRLIIRTKLNLLMEALYELENHSNQKLKDLYIDVD